MPFENNILSLIESAIPLIMLLVFIVVFWRAYIKARSIKESAGFDRRWYEQQRRRLTLEREDEEFDAYDGSFDPTKEGTGWI